MSEQELAKRVAKLEENDRLTQVLLERIEGHYETIKESLDILLKLPPKVDKIEERLKQIETDVAFLKLVAHSH